MSTGPAPSWFPIRRQLLDSSVWEENPTVRVLWVTLLLVASEPGRRGTADMTVRALAGRACLSPEETREALDVLMSPDPRSRSKDLDGRRLEPMDPARDWGWRLVNWEQYERDRDTAGSALRMRRHRSTSRNVTEGYVTVTGRSEEKEKEKEKGGGSPPPPRPPQRSHFAPPSEDEWLAYCSKTWPDWTRHDILAAHGHYDGLGWAKVKSWRGCAKTCYHRQAGQSPRNGRPAPALIGAHKPGPKLREVDEDAPEEIVAIVTKLRRREATDAEVAALDAWQRGAS